MYIVKKKKVYQHAFIKTPLTPIRDHFLYSHIYLMLEFDVYM